MRFPYQRYEVVPGPTFPGGILYRPEVAILVIGGAGSESLLALADTGADETLLPRSVGEAVGAVMDDSQRWSVGAFGGEQMQAVLGEVQFAIRTPRKLYRWNAGVGFISFSNPEHEVAVLGQIGFFDHFVVSFNSRRRHLTLTPYKNRH